jgi:cell division septum initiation protein DivIVA
MNAHTIQGIFIDPLNREIKELRQEIKQLKEQLEHYEDLRYDSLMDLNIQKKWSKE